MESSPSRFDRFFHLFQNLCIDFAKPFNQPNPVHRAYLIQQCYWR